MIAFEFLLSALLVLVLLAAAVLTLDAWSSYAVWQSGVLNAFVG